MVEPADDLRARALDALRGVIDPEIGLDIVELGLVYDVEVRGANVFVRMTMTTPACPMGESIVADADLQLRAVDGVDDVAVDLVWDPPWTPERMSPAAREMLGWRPR